jgi:hypothetical protein
VHFSLSEPVRAPSGQIEVSVTLDWGEAVAGAGLQLKIAYDPALMRPARISTGAAAGDLSFTDNRSTAVGELLINGTGGSLRGKGEILRLFFDQIAPAGSAPAPGPGLRRMLDSGLPDGVLTLYVLQVRDSANRVLVPPPAVQVQIWLAQLGLAGDLNYDTRIDDDDIPVLLSRIVQGKLDPLTVAGILPIADLDRDGSLNSGDIPVLRRKIREAAGQTPGLSSIPTAAQYAVDALETHGRPSDLVSMPIDLSDAAGLAAVYLQVNFDRNVLSFVEGQRPAGCLGTQFDMTVSESEGVLHIVMNRDTSLLAGAGTLTNLRFRINPGAKPGMVADVVVAEASLSSDSGAASWWRSKTIQGKGRVWVTLSPTTDSDSDGVSDYAEQVANGSRDYNPYDPVHNPTGSDTRYDLADSDGDGLSDGFETAHGLNPVAFGDQLIDNDGDALNNLGEQAARTDPNSGDTDGDGIPDGAEVADRTDPLHDDAAEDPDQDGYPNLLEYVMGTDPLAKDPPARLPVMQAGRDQAGTFATLAFTRRIADGFATCYVQESTDLDYWRTVPIRPAMTSPPPPVSPGFERVTVRVGGPDASIRMLRLAALKRSDSEPDGMPDDFEQALADADPTDDVYGPEDVLPGGDFDGDGISNLGEFLFGMDPAAAGEPDHLPQMQDITIGDNEESVLVFRCRVGALPAGFVVEQSLDSLNWYPLDILSQLLERPAPLDDGTEEFLLRPEPSANPEQSIFLRVSPMPSE